MGVGDNPIAKRVFGDIDFGTAIRIVRTARGMTAKELAEKSGTSLEQVSRIENGSISSNPTIKTLRKLAEGLGTDIRTLVTIQDDIISLLNKEF